MTEQQKFEVYFLASRKSKGKGRRVSFDLLPDGTYADDHTQRHWWTWQNAWQARAAQDKSAEWQPIETAPKDGSAVLVSDGWRIFCVEWNEEFEWWVVDDNKLGPFRLRGYAPLYWMPLPPPPKGTE